MTCNKGVLFSRSGQRVGVVAGFIMKFICNKCIFFDFFILVLMNKSHAISSIKLMSQTLLMKYFKQNALVLEPFGRSIIETENTDDGNTRCQKRRARLRGNHEQEV